MKSENTVLIDQDYLRELLESDDLLAALYQMGVEDWPGYEEAQQLMADEAVEQELNNRK